jgi:alanyl-tRNA synthetase
MLTDDLIEKGLDAVIIIKRISNAISGGGGGQAFYAIAGGSNVDGLEHAIDLAREMIIQ